LKVAVKALCLTANPSLFLNSLFIGSNGQAVSVVGAHIRVESQEFIEVDGPMPLEYGAGINPFSPL